MDRPDDLDKVNVPERINLIREALKLDTPPERCYPTEPHGTKGNMKIAKGCNWCPFKQTCYSDANDGEGLRTFKYSKQYIHLTEVVETPRVEEVL